MVTNQKKVHRKLGMGPLDITHKSKARWQPPWMVTNYSKDGHPPTQGWSPTNPRMVTHQKELLYTLEIRHLDITHQTKVPWMVTYHA